MQLVHVPRLESRCQPGAQGSVVSTVARYLGVTQQRVTQMVAEGKLPAAQLDSLGPSWTGPRSSGGPSDIEMGHEPVEEPTAGSGVRLTG
jgi:hypothetical protein